MIDKNNIPKFFHRLRKEDQKTIRVGFLFSEFNDFILPYLEVKNEKISKTVFFINESEKETISEKVKEKVNEWINFKEEDAFKVAQNIYDKKIDILIVLSDNKFTAEVLNYHAAPVQIAGANTLNLKGNVDAVFENKIETIDFIEKRLEEAIFALFDYLVSLKNDIPSLEELKILWGLANETGRPINENEFAIIERILLIRPKDPEIINPLAVILSYHTKENIESALEFFPENTLAKDFLTFKLADEEKNWEIAEILATKILNLIPNNAQEQYIMSETLYMLGRIYENMGKINDAIDKFIECVKTSDTNSEVKFKAYSKYLFMLHYTDMSPKEILEKSKEYGSLFKNIAKYSHQKKAKKKIRVGYISTDFRAHIVAFFSFVFFTAKNSERFETYAYMLNEEDSFTNLFKKNADCYRNLKDFDYDKAAKIIYDDDIDILFDLSSHSTGISLPILARKPAPIQISGIGYFATTGLPEVDYFLVDKYIAPKSEDALFTEKLIRLPHSHFCYININPHDKRTNSFEKNNFITFGSMNSANKMNDKVWSTWAEILKRVPNSKLFLKSKFYADPIRLNKEKEQMKKYNIAAERVIFEEYSSNYLDKYNNIDIALDTFPYPGGGTTCDALLMSAPVITLSGNSCHERFGKSILYNIGLEELVASSIEEYIDIAVNLANDKIRIKKYHDEIYNLMANSALMNQNLYIKDLEAAYEKIYEEWLEIEE